MTAQVEFHGTSAESTDLVRAIAHNCTCDFGLMGVRISTCPAHAALIGDQRWLNGLVFERRRCASRFPGAGLRVVRAP